MIYLRSKKVSSNQTSRLKRVSPSEKIKSDRCAPYLLTPFTFRSSTREKEIHPDGCIRAQVWESISGSLSRNHRTDKFLDCNEKREGVAGWGGCRRGVEINKTGGEVHAEEGAKVFPGSHPCLVTKPHVRLASLPYYHLRRACAHDEAAFVTYPIRAEARARAIFISLLDSPAVVSKIGSG